MKIKYNGHDNVLQVGRKKFNLNQSVGKILADMKVPFAQWKRLVNNTDIDNHNNDTGSFLDRGRRAGGVLRTYFNAIGEHRKPIKQGYYPSIRFPLRDFFENPIINSPLFTSGTFLDIGSCNGEKLAAARHLGYKKVMGIEISSESCKIARRVFKGEPNVEIYNSDAFERGDVINKADVVYTYVPISDHNLMEKLYLHIINNLKVGAVHVEVAGGYLRDIQWPISDKKQYQMFGRSFYCTQKINSKQIKICGSGEIFDLDKVKQRKEEKDILAEYRLSLPF